MINNFELIFTGFLFVFIVCCGLGFLLTYLFPDVPHLYKYGRYSSFISVLALGVIFLLAIALFFASPH